MKNIALAAMLASTLVFARTLPAAEESVTADRKAAQDARPEIRYRTPMDMDQPMPTGMAKPGMKKGDVKNSAEKKQTEMEKMMGEEMK